MCYIVDVRENVVVEVGELMEKNDLLNETLQEYKNTYNISQPHITIISFIT